MSDIQPTYVLYGSGLNYDDDPRFVRKGDGKERLNVSVSSDGSQGVIKSIKGNERIYAPLPNGINKCIGTIDNTENKSVVYFIWNSLFAHSIYEYFIDMGIILKVHGMDGVSRNPTLEFTKNMEITGEVIDGICVFNDKHTKVINLNAAIIYTNGFTTVSSTADMTTNGIYKIGDEYYYYNSGQKDDTVITESSIEEKIIYIVDDDGNYIINNEGEYVIL